MLHDTPEDTDNLQDIKDIFRDKVLHALDSAANETFMPVLHARGKSLRNDSGATDTDLPRLFKAIDEQVEVLAKRYDVS